MKTLTREMIMKIWHSTDYETRSKYLRFYNCIDLEELLNALVPKKVKKS